MNHWNRSGIASGYDGPPRKRGRPPQKKKRSAKPPKKPVGRPRLSQEEKLEKTIFTGAGRQTTKRVAEFNEKLKELQQKRANCRQATAQSRQRQERPQRLREFSKSNGYRRCNKRSCIHHPRFLEIKTFAGNQCRPPVLEDEGKQAYVAECGTKQPQFFLRNILKIERKRGSRVLVLTFKREAKEKRRDKRYSRGSGLFSVSAAQCLVPT